MGDGAAFSASPPPLIWEGGLGEDTAVDIGEAEAGVGPSAAASLFASMICSGAMTRAAASGVLLAPLFCADLCWRWDLRGPAAGAVREDFSLGGCVLVSVRIGGGG